MSQKKTPVIVSGNLQELQKITDDEQVLAGRLVNLEKKVLSWNSLTKVLDFVDIFNTYVKTDLSVTDMAWFATQAINVDLSTGLKQGSLEGRSDSYYKGYSWCYTYKAEDILPTLNEILNPYDMDLTAEDLDLPKASSYYFKY